MILGIDILVEVCYHVATGKGKRLTQQRTAQEERAVNTFDFINIIFQVVKFVVEVILKIIELTMKKRE